MERDGEADAELGAAALDHRHDTGGGERDPPARERDTLRVHDDAERLGDVVVVEERLPHTHHHDVGEHARPARRRPFAVRIAGHEELGDDLAGIQIAHHALGAGVAEGAGKRAAHLGGDAERAAILLRDVDGFHLAAIGEAQQPLSRPVRRTLLRRRLGACQGIALGERGAQRAGDGRHRAEFDGAPVVNPVPELLGPHPDPLRRHADSLQALGKLVAREPDQALAFVLYGIRLACCAGAGAGPGTCAGSPVYGHALTMES